MSYKIDVSKPYTFILLLHILLPPPFLPVPSFLLFVLLPFLSPYILLLLHRFLLLLLLVFPSPEGATTPTPGALSIFSFPRAHQSSVLMLPSERERDQILVERSLKCKLGGNGVLTMYVEFGFSPLFPLSREYPHFPIFHLMVVFQAFNPFPPTTHLQTQARILLSVQAARFRLRHNEKCSAPTCYMSSPLLPSPFTPPPPRPSHPVPTRFNFSPVVTQFHKISLSANHPTPSPTPFSSSQSRVVASPSGFFCSFDARRS